eukprot:EG_transcript_5787
MTRIMSGSTDCPPSPTNKRLATLRESVATLASFPTSLLEVIKLVPAAEQLPLHVMHSALVVQVTGLSERMEDYLQDLEARRSFGTQSFRDSCDSMPAESQEPVLMVTQQLFAVYGIRENPCRMELSDSLEMIFQEALKTKAHNEALVQTCKALAKQPHRDNNCPLSPVDRRTKIPNRNSPVSLREGLLMQQLRNAEQEVDSKLLSPFGSSRSSSIPMSPMALEARAEDSPRTPQTPKSTLAFEVGSPISPQSLAGRRDSNLSKRSPVLRFRLSTSRRPSASKSPESPDGLAMPSLSLPAADGDSVQSTRTSISSESATGPSNATNAFNTLMADTSAPTPTDAKAVVGLGFLRNMVGMTSGLSFNDLDNNNI